MTAICANRRRLIAGSTFPYYSSAQKGDCRQAMLAGGKTPWRPRHVMNRITNTLKGRFRPVRCRGFLSVALCAGMLAGCSSVPDALNPVEWYRDTRDWIAGSDEPEKSKTAPKPSTADSKDFPKLSTVPPRPQPPTTAERNRLARSLAADREQARYSDEIIRRQTDTSGKMTETVPSSTTIPKAAEIVPAPASRAEPPSPSPAASPAAGRSAPPFPPMPAAPPAPPQTAADVPPMPSPAAAPPPMPEAAMTAPPMPQTAMAAPPMPRTEPAAPTPAPAATGNATFGPLPPDIALNSSRPAAPALRPPPGAAGQQPGPSDQFSSRFPADAGTAPQSFSMAPGQPLGTIRFGVGSAELSNSARAAIGRIARTIKQSGARVRVVGHASSRTRNMDPMSHHMVNFKVSLDRANAVARELRRRGVNPSTVTVEAVSDTQPVFIEVMPAGEAGNRRVEILIEN